LPYLVLRDKLRATVTQRRFAAVLCGRAPSVHGRSTANTESSAPVAACALDGRALLSALRAAVAEQELLARIRPLDFGSKDVAQMVVSWPVDFLPS
jgi:hypothetical protein